MAGIINTLVQIMAPMEMWVVPKVSSMLQGASHFFDVPCLLFSLQAGHFFSISAWLLSFPVRQFRSPLNSQ